MAGSKIIVAALMCAAVWASSLSAARAADCPGHPDALGTSRTLVVDPREHPRIGTMQYGETLPLADKEVVLTFDDGPLPPHSAKILEILASECVKATFFIIGRMARDYPQGVRQVRDAGHTIGTHSQNHLLRMNKMPIEQARREIDDGIAATAAALGSEAAVAPFFRIPGLLRAENVEDYLASKGIQTWSADFPADDWRHIPASRVYDLAMSRLEAKGKGILLLHDIQERTVEALPHILSELKARGFRIVHVVPATPDMPKTPTEPREWRLRPATDAIASARWPDRVAITASGPPSLPAPSPLLFDDRETTLVLDTAPARAPWSPPAPMPATAATLIVPEPSIYAMPDDLATADWSKPAARRVAAAPRGTSREIQGDASDDAIARLIAHDAGSSRRISHR